MSKATKKKLMKRKNKVIRKKDVNKKVKKKSTALAIVVKKKQLPAIERRHAVKGGLSLVEFKQNLAILKKFTKDYLVEGPDKDYGFIYRKDGSKVSDKRSLFKPGAEKLGEFYQYRTKMVCVRHTEDFAKGLFAYTYRCEIFRLSDPPGAESIAQCEGAANSLESNFIGKPSNTVLKMGQKRAYVGAIIMATRSSQWFTQDIEDKDDQGNENKQKKEDPNAKTHGVRRFYSLCTEAGESKEFVKSWLKLNFKKESATNIPDDDLGNLIKRLEIVSDIVRILKDKGHALGAVRKSIAENHGFESWLDIPADKLAAMLKTSKDYKPGSQDGK